MLRLVARGHSNHQMTERLSVSERTVYHHIEHIYTKIGVATRAAATLFAMPHNLLNDMDETEKWAQQPMRGTCSPGTLLLAAQ